MPSSRCFPKKTVQRGEVILRKARHRIRCSLSRPVRSRYFKTSAQGKEQILSIARPGEALNDIPIFDGGTNPVNATGPGAGHTWSALRKRKLQSILQQYPNVRAEYEQSTGAREWRMLVTLVEDLSFRMSWGG